MNEIISTMKKRRSIRRYSPEQIDEAVLNEILEAGRYAPSGGNNQSTHIIVIQNGEILEKLRVIVQQEFAKMEIEDHMYNGLKNSINISKRGDYHFYFDAPTLVVVANKKGYGNAMADCSCVLENMMIAATSLNIGSCWINQLRWLDENPVIKDFLYTLGLKKNEVVCGGLSLGYLPDEMTYPNPIAHDGNPITWVK